MRPGMSVRVEVVRRSIEKALLAPRTALAFDTVRAQARSVGGAVVPVKIGWCNHEACVIEGGLEAGTKLAAFELVPNGRP
jgi:hypothetical protein